MKKGNRIINNNSNYLLIKLIGNGGSGVVWKAHSNGKDYAIKFINSTDKNKNYRFNKELEFCKNNQNKNIVTVLGDGEFENKHYYIMPFFSKTLRDVINEEADAGVLIKYILQLCKAIQFIHKQGVIHRDIKPENILIDGKHLVLADFGIAHFNYSSLTKKSNLLANRNYSAPEQQVKNNALNIGKPADMYALGLIIIECFTKQNRAGSSYKSISDAYPLYWEFDSLASNMINQNADERLPIDTVILELKFKFGNIKKNLKITKSELLSDGYPQDITKKTLGKIIKRASEDLLFAKFIFENKSIQEIDSYNHNWHMKIGYCVDDFLYKLYEQEQIFAICKNKFNYEGNIRKLYESLNVSENAEHKQIYLEMEKILTQYSLRVGFYKWFDMSNKIQKYFTSCCDYHCQEIVTEIKSPNFLRSSREDLLDAPILHIVSSLKNTIKEKADSFASINLAEHIQINWDRTRDFETNADEIELIESIKLRKDVEIDKILSEFSSQWGINYNRTTADNYSIKFRSFKQFDKFKKYALQLAKPYYIFEGDVMSIVNHYDCADAIVEIKLGRIFDIPNTLAKILGLRKI